MITTGYNKINIVLNWPTYTEGQFIRFKYVNGGLEQTVTYTFKETRVNPYEVTIGIDATETASNLRSAIQADLGPLGFQVEFPLFPIFPYSVEVNGPNEVLYPNFNGFVNNSFSTNVTNVYATFGYVAPTQVIEILAVDYEPADDNYCTKIKAKVTTNIQASSVASPYFQEVFTNPFYLDLDRGQVYNLTVVGNGSQSTQQITTPSLLDVNNIDLDINNTPYGAVLNMFNNNQGTQLKYSLDGSDWTSNNVFTEIEDGQHTIEFKDQFGCQKERTFNVDLDTGIYSEYFYISKSNSIRYANRINFGDSGNYKNDENTLSCESDVKLPYKEVQQFNSGDIITTQFKSNYSSNRAFIVQKDLPAIELLVEKKSDFIGRKDSRSATVVSLGNGKAGIYYSQGVIFDYDTGSPIGTYTLNGFVPAYGVVGNWLNIDGVGWFQITEKRYDSNLNADLLVINYSYVGNNFEAVVKCQYNLFNFEAYEFTIDMSDYLDKNIKVRIEARDDNFTDITYLSECINIKVKHEDTKEIRYWNNKNNDVFYQTGIRHLIRIPWTKTSGKDTQEQDSYKTDVSAVLLSSEIHETNVFTFEPVTKEIWRKIKIALSSEEVFIDGVKYIKNTDIETEGPLNDTNLYVVTAEMVKTGAAYSNYDTGTYFDSSSAEIPALVEQNNGYLEY